MSNDTTEPAFALRFQQTTSPSVEHDRLLGVNGRARATLEATMPILIVPLLIGIPVLIGGGYFIIKAFQ